MITAMMGKVTSGGRITIPVELRRKFGIKPGMRFAIEIDEDQRRIILSPINREYVHRLRGKYRGMGLMKALREERQREADK